MSEIILWVDWEMPDFWLDADSLITPSRGPYRFNILPAFWDFLEQKAKEQIIGSPELVLSKELTNSDPKKADSLEKWAVQQNGVLFLPPDSDIQKAFSQIAEDIKANKNYKVWEVAKCLDGADPWLIAYAKAKGGRIVTFEKSEPNARSPKIPDVANKYNVKCINIYDMLSELKASF